MEGDSSDIEDSLVRNNTEEFCFSGLDEHQLFNFENGIDPENNLYDDFQVNSDYYSENLSNVNLKGFSIIHLNCRSLYANFVNIKDYLESLKQKFQVIALSETWITKEKVANFVLEGYDFLC